MPAELTKVSPQQIFNFTQDYSKNATRKTNVTSQQQRAQMVQQELTLNPQTLGAWSRRISLQDQLSKSVHKRFIDIMS